MRHFDSRYQPAAKGTLDESVALDYRGALATSKAFVDRRYILSLLKLFARLDNAITHLLVGKDRRSCRLERVLVGIQCRVPRPNGYKLRSLRDQQRKRTSSLPATSPFSPPSPPSGEGPGMRGRTAGGRVRARDS